MILMRGRALESVLVFGTEQSTVCIYYTIIISRLFKLLLSTSINGRVLKKWHHASINVKQMKWHHASISGRETYQLQLLRERGFDC
jgi:hypothetical protein